MDDVYKSDIDSNKHVNNIRYFHWLLDSLPDEVPDNCFLRLINAKFYSESKYGEKIKIYRRGTEQNTFLHTMRSNLDNRLLVAARSVWQNKKQGYANPGNPAGLAFEKM